MPATEYKKRYNLKIMYSLREQFKSSINGYEFMICLKDFIY